MPNYNCSQDNRSTINKRFSRTQQSVILVLHTAAETGILLHQLQGSQMNLAATDQSLGELNDLSSIELQPFPIEFTSKLSSGLTRCLDENSKSFVVRSDVPYEVLFVEPAYVATIEIEFSKPVLGASLELTVFDALSAKSVRKRLPQDLLSNKAVFKINLAASGFSILLQPGLFEFLGRRTLDLKRIHIDGFSAGDFVELTASLTEVQGLRESAIEELTEEKRRLEVRNDKIVQRETAVAQLEQQKEEELADLESRLSDAKEETQEAITELTRLKSEIASAQTRKQAIIESVSVQEATVRSIDGEIAKGKEQLRVLAVETSEKEHRLRELTSNVNLFSEEFSSFSDHGAKQARIFIGLSVVPLLIITILTAQLLLGAVDLSVKYVKEPNLDLMTVFVTRLPYLTICASILGVCYSIQRFLFNRISAIFAERLDFSKIGILAKDVASASAHGLQLADSELYEARTYLKIQMIKSYLSGSIGSFTYAKRKPLADKQAGDGEDSSDLPHEPVSPDEEES